MLLSTLPARSLCAHFSSVQSIICSCDYVYQMGNKLIKLVNYVVTGHGLVPRFPTESVCVESEWFPQSLKFSGDMYLRICTGIAFQISKIMDGHSIFDLHLTNSKVSWSRVR